MGFLSKIGKGIKKTFKKIGKSIKKGLNSIGKFMDKIGIVGQIGLSLLLPGIGGILAEGFGAAFNAMTGAMTGYAGVGSTIVNGAGNFLAKAGTLATQVGKSFSTITEGVKNVVGETLKAGANALGVDKALIKAGQTLGSDYLETLGNNIGEANLSSIGETFRSNFKDVVGSFGKIGKDLGGVPSTSTKLTDGAVTPQPENIYNPDIVTPDISTAQVQTESLLSPNVDITPPAVGDPSAVVNRKISVQAEASLDSAFDEEFNPDFTPAENKAMRSGDFSAIKKAADPESLFDKTMRLGREKIQELPGEAIDKLGSTITDMPSQYAMKLSGLRPDPVYNQTSYATVVPTIQEAPMVGSQGTIDPVQYVANNQQSMGLQPFGFNANMYNEATYLTAMRKYGLA